MLVSTERTLTQNNNVSKPTAIEIAKALNRKRKKWEWEKRWREENRELYLARKKKLYEANPHRHNLYYKDNCEKIKNRSARWGKENPDKILLTCARRRADKLNRTPPWYEYDAVKAVYEKAAKCRAAGVDVHVDHIIPLQGKLVSGLHCVANLQIATASENMSKHNKFEVAA